MLTKAALRAQRLPVQRDDICKPEAALDACLTASRSNALHEANAEVQQLQTRSCCSKHSILD